MLFCLQKWCAASFLAGIPSLSVISPPLGISFMQSGCLRCRANQRGGWVDHRPCSLCIAMSRAYPICGCEDASGSTPNLRSCIDFTHFTRAVCNMFVSCPSINWGIQMKKRKKWSGIALACMILLSLWGCDHEEKSIQPVDVDTVLNWQAPAEAMVRASPFLH